MLKASGAFSFGAGVISSASDDGDCAVGAVVACASPGDAEADRPSTYASVSRPKRSLGERWTCHHARADEASFLYSIGYSGWIRQFIAILSSIHFHVEEPKPAE